MATDYCATLPCGKALRAGLPSNEKYLKLGFLDNCVAAPSKPAPPSPYKTLAVPGSPASDHPRYHEELVFPRGVVAGELAGRAVKDCETKQPLRRPRSPDVSRIVPEGHHDVGVDTAGVRGPSGAVGRRFHENRAAWPADANEFAEQAHRLSQVLQDVSADHDIEAVVVEGDLFPIQIDGAELVSDRKALGQRQIAAGMLQVGAHVPHRKHRLETETADIENRTVSRRIEQDAT